MQTLIGFGHLGNAPHDDDNDDTIEILDESRVNANNDIENGGDSAGDDGANEDDDEEGQEGDSPLTGDWCCHVRSATFISTPSATTADNASANASTTATRKLLADN